MQKYQTTPETVHAVQFTRQNHDEITQLLGDLIRKSISIPRSLDGIATFMLNSEGVNQWLVSEGDYILQDIQGKFSSMKGPDFLLKYVPVMENHLS